MKKNYKELFSNLVVFAMSNIGTKLILFFLVPIYTKYMTSSEYGVAELIVTTTGLVIPLVTLAINEAVYRFTIDKNTEDKEVLRCFYHVYIISICITILITIVLLCIPSIRKYAFLFALIIIFSIINDGYALFVKGRGKNKVFAIDNIVYVAVLTLCNLLFLIKFNMSINGYLFAIIVAKFISLIYLMVFGKSPKWVSFLKIDHVLLKRMLMYSIPLLFNSLNWWVISSSDKYMLNYMVNSSEVGLFTVASKIPALVNVVTTVFTEAWTISSIKEHEEGAGSDFYNSVFEIYSICMALLVSFIMLIARPFMKIYVTQDFYSAVVFLPTLLMGAYYLGYSTFIGVTFSTVMKSEIIMKSSLYAAVINIILNFMLIPILGGLGASIATMGTYMVISFYRYIKAQKYMPVSFSKIKFVMTIIILLFQQIMVTLNIKWVYVSIICIVLLVFIYLKTIKNIFNNLLVVIASRLKHKT